MEPNITDRQKEQEKLETTIDLASKQLIKAQEANETNKSSILAAKKELRENTVHSFGSLYSGDNFEALVELNQYSDAMANQLADFEATQRKITTLEGIIKCPYFARVDFTFEGESEVEEIYIGRASLMQDNAYELCVYDWRAPIASMFYRFVSGPSFFDAPNGRIEGDISLKRQYEIKNSTLDYFFDADVQIVDEFLRKLLSHNTSPKMKTIVETIQKEQDLVIRDMENGLMMVQGVAGSGKTSIALHRAAYLMYQGLSAKLGAHNILILSPNTLFEQYISNVLPELGEDNVVSFVFEEILDTILPYQQIQSRNEFLENLITTTNKKSLIRHSIAFKTSPLFLQILHDFIVDFPTKWIAFEDVYYDNHLLVEKNILKKKIISGRVETPLAMKLEQLEDFIVEKLIDWKKKKISNEEIHIFRSQQLKFTKLNIKSLYRRLMSDRHYFYSLCEKYTLPEGIGAILNYTTNNFNSPQIAYEDATVIAYLTLKINGASLYKTIKHVVIDEAQDYYPLHFEIFNLLFPKAKFTVLGDINQTLEKGEDMTLYERVGEILKKPTQTLVTMDKSFRCTNEILNFGAHFLEKASPVISFNRTGDRPTITSTHDLPTYKEKLITEINVCLEKGYESIGLICKNQEKADMIFDLLQKEIPLKVIQNESTDDLQGILVMPVYMSKGLEFDVVFICDCDANHYVTQDDKKLLYIASTRALHRLHVFSMGTASALLPNLK